MKMLNHIKESWSAFSVRDRLDTLLSSGVKAPSKLVDKNWGQLPKSVKTKIEKQMGYL